MGIRVAINGFGRIGRNVFRILHQDPAFEVVAVNDLGPADMLAYLLRYDSVHGRFPGEVAHEEGSLLVDGRRVRVLAEKDPAALPWGELDVSCTVEATGIFRTREGCTKHLQAGARRVVLTVPAKDQIDNTVVMGVNHGTLEAGHRIISNASCTTNCLASVAKVLQDAFGISHGLMTTVHAYTNDQRILDVLHKDPRRARAAGANIIPTTTGAAKAVGLVIPELQGRMHGMAFRVPVIDGSVVDLVAEVERDVTVEGVNAAFKEASEGSLRGYLAYTQDPIVSSDIVGDSHSAIVDGQSTMLMGKRMVKVVAWYDNEWGYSNRVCDLIKAAAALD